MGPSEFSCSGTAETAKDEGPLSFDGEDAEVGSLAYGATFAEAE